MENIRRKINGSPYFVRGSWGKPKSIQVSFVTLMSLSLEIAKDVKRQVRMVITFCWSFVLREDVDDMTFSPLTLQAGFALLRAVGHEWIQSTVACRWHGWSWITSGRSRAGTTKRWRRTVVRPDANNLLGFRVARQWLVVAQVNVIQVSYLPALTTKVSWKGAREIISDLKSMVDETHLKQDSSRQ